MKANPKYDSDLPEAIKAFVKMKEYTVNDIGKSDSEVRVFDEYVLKIQPATASTDNEARMLIWLKGKVSVPELNAYEKQDGTAYTLTSRMTGKMLCDVEYLDNQDRLIKICAEGIRQLWAVDISTCPGSISRLDVRLKEAREKVESGLINAEDLEPDTLSSNGFSDIYELLEWLEVNRPTEDIVLTHGDFCLPNLFADGDRFMGFIDLGSAGPADRWQDIALLLRSIKYNLDGVYGGPKRDGFSAEKVLSALDIEMDSDKLKYYLLLDQL